MADDPKRPAPPYIAFQTLKTLLQNMKADGVPGRIDKTMLRNFSGAVASQLITALKFLNLTNGDGVPTTQMRDLVSAYGSEDWPVVLGSVIKAAFSPIFALNLETATPGQFTEKFGDVFDGEGDTMRKAVTFFVNAVREAKIPISNYIMRNKKPRAANGKKRVKAATGTVTGKAEVRGGGGIVLPTIPAVEKPPSEILLGLFDAKMQQPEQDAVWTLIKYFKAAGR